MDLFETPLPGIGTRYEFTTDHNDHVCVVVRRDGARDIVLFDHDDPDSTRGSVELSPHEAGNLAELLGGTSITARLDELKHQVEGLEIVWVTMPQSGGLTGKTIADGKIRTTTSASVVAVIREEEAFPGPQPDFTFAPGDTVLVIGGSEAVSAASSILTG